VHLITVRDGLLADCPDRQDAPYRDLR
jgi:hypothetical protein